MPTVSTNLEKLSTKNAGFLENDDVTIALKGFPPIVAFSNFRGVE